METAPHCSWPAAASAVRARGERATQQKWHYVYVHVKLIVWCFSSNFYIDATLRLL